MFLSNEPFGFEHGHIIADGRRGHAELVALEQGLRSHGRLGGDVIRDDGAQDFLAAGIGGAGHDFKVIRSGGMVVEAAPIRRGVLAGRQRCQMVSLLWSP